MSHISCDLSHCWNISTFLSFYRSICCIELTAGILRLFSHATLLLLRFSQQLPARSSSLYSLQSTSTSLSLSLSISLGLGTDLNSSLH